MGAELVEATTGMTLLWAIGFVICAVALFAIAFILLYSIWADDFGQLGKTTLFLAITVAVIAYLVSSSAWNALGYAENRESVESHYGVTVHTKGNFDAATTNDPSHYKRGYVEFTPASGGDAMQGLIEFKETHAVLLVSDGNNGYTEYEGAENGR